MPGGPSRSGPPSRLPPPLTPPPETTPATIPAPSSASSSTRRNTIVPDARVELFRKNLNYPFCTELLDETRADAAGRFSFKDRPEFRTFHVRAEADGHISRWRDCQAGVRTVLLLPRGVPLSGTVYDRQSMTPVEGVRLEHSYSGSNDFVSHGAVTSTVTDAAGRYILYCNPSSKLYLQLFPPGMLPQVRQLTIQQEPVTRDFFLEWGTALPGRVVSAHTGRPLAGATVHDHYQTPPITSTDAAGGFELSPPADTTTLHFYIRRAATVEGIVLSSAGAPVEGAPVYVGPGRITLDDLPGSLALAVELNAQVLPTTESASHATLTDSEGRFTIRGVVPLDEERSVGTKIPGLATTRVPVVIDRAGTYGPVELIVGPGASVEGRVTFAGRPAQVQLTHQVGKSYVRVQSNQHGRYRMSGLPAGPAFVQVWPPGFAPLIIRDNPLFRREVQLVDGETQRLDIDLALARMVVSGVVRDSLGMPIPDTVAYLSCNEVEYAGYAETAGDGTFRHECWVPAAWLDLPAVAGARHGPARTEVACTMADLAGLDLTLPRLGAIRLRVEAVDVELPQGGLDLWWRKAEDQEFQVFSRSLLFPPEGLELRFPEGDLVLKIDESEHGIEAVTREVVVTDGQTTPVSILLHPASDGDA